MDLTILIPVPERDSDDYSRVVPRARSRANRQRFSRMNLRSPPETTVARGFAAQQPIWSMDQLLRRVGQRCATIATQLLEETKFANSSNGVDDNGVAGARPPMRHSCFVTASFRRWQIPI